MSVRLTKGYLVRKTRNSCVFAEKCRDLSWIISKGLEKNEIITELRKPRMLGVVEIRSSEYFSKAGVANCFRSLHFGEM